MSKKILIVDDEEMLRTTMQLVLKRSGYTVVSADSGEAGLELIRQELPDLIVSDVYMPNMTGVELLAALRADPSISSIPFVLMTGKVEDLPMRQGLRLGADDYLSKPFTAGELVETVKVRLARQQQIQNRAEKKIDELRTHLSSTLPHELLTPLAGILGAAELIRTDFHSMQQAEIVDMVWNIEKCAQRLVKLARNHFLFVELTMARQDPNRRQTFLLDQCPDAAEVVRLIANQMAEFHLRREDLTLDTQPACVAISSDLLRTLVQELVDNAFKFSARQKPVQVTARIEGYHWILEVADAGRGMTTEQFDKIGAYVQFERDQHEQQGLGLGLSIVKNLMELHNGTLHLKTEVSVGTTMVVRLPLVEPPKT